MKTPILVSIVSYQDACHLNRCLSSVVAQSRPTRIKVLDNAAEPECRRIAGQFPIEFESSDVNLGFSKGHNRNLEGEEFEWALLLNPDVILEPDYLERLLRRLRGKRRVGTASGKLRRMTAEGEPVLRNGRSILDSTGIYFTPSLRHFDRGSGQVDRGQYDRAEFVFGVTGAALLLSRGLYEDVKMGNEFLDEDFFIYREDADLAWRAQLRGWRSLYVPEAAARHLRHVTPERRRRLSSAINYHSVKNRFLMRRKNMDWRVRLRCAPFMWTRDLGIVIYILLFERSSLAAFRFLWQARRRMKEKRERIQSGSRHSVAWWFAFTPRSQPLTPTINAEGCK